MYKDDKGTESLKSKGQNHLWFQKFHNFLNLFAWFLQYNSKQGPFGDDDDKKIECLVNTTTHMIKEWDTFHMVLTYLNIRPVLFYLYPIL